MVAGSVTVTAAASPVLTGAAAATAEAATAGSRGSRGNTVNRSTAASTATRAATTSAGARFELHRFVFTQSSLPPGLRERRFS